MEKRGMRREAQESALVVDIHLTRGLVAVLLLVLLAAACLGYLAWGEGAAAASSPRPAHVSLQARPAAASAGVRGFYLTTGTYQGDAAASACASGYHMASLWEIIDPSNFEYDVVEGYTMDDSGQGPPSYGGWVRTGWMSDNSGTAGEANCSAWTTTSGSGSTAYLPGTWIGGLSDLAIWDVGTAQCSANERVWCVED